MADPPELSPEDKAYVEEKTRRMVAVAALRKIHRLVENYDAPIDLHRQRQPRELPPDVHGSVPPHARRVAGFAAMVKVRQLVRQYREEREAARKAAIVIAAFFAALLTAGVLLVLFAPEIMHALLRVLS